MMKNTAEHDEQNDNSNQVTLPSPGEALSRARKEKGLGIDEVVTHLGLPRRVLCALEADEYDRLPAPMYVRGYVRRYCGLLELKDGPLLELVDRQFAAQGIVDHNPSLRLMAPPRKKIHPIWFVAPVVVLLLTALAVFVWGMLSNNVSEGEAELSASEPTAEEFTPVLEMTALSNTSGNDLEFAEPELDGAAMVEEAGDDGMRTLAIRVNQQSWVEVFDAEGDMLVADLKPSGTELEVTGLAPFNVTLGYAPGVELSFAGEPVSIGHISSDNTATLKVGDEPAEER
jgi:cytoskeleton protein RodZ